MKRREFIETTGKSSFAILGLRNFKLFDNNKFEVAIQQITYGSKHHFFGYIGQSLTIPWNSSGTRILTLRSAFHDHLPGGHEPADVAIISLDQTEGNFYKVEKVDESLGWNFQQGTMFYWNPDKPANQFFFNDRDLQTGKVFTVLYDIHKGRRIREYKFEDTPVGNSGVCPVGKSFLAINYARLARLRPVTGYLGAADWTEGTAAPENDGIFIINSISGDKKLLVSFARLEVELNKAGFAAKGRSLFINHTLWNRAGNLIYFFVRAGWQADSDPITRINVPCTIDADGNNLIVGHQYIGGHPEWGIGHGIIGNMNGKQVIYDVLDRKVIDSIGTSEIIPNPGGDISLSPNGQWFVNGFVRKNKNYYNIIRLTDGRWVRSPGFYKGDYEGDLRIDPAPRWNRQNNQILVDCITENGTRQLFIITILP
jgi:hypothetical protein